MEQNVFVFLTSPTNDDVYTTFACSLNDQAISAINHKFNDAFFTNNNDFKSIIELVIKGCDSKAEAYRVKIHKTDFYLDSSVEAQVHFEKIKNVLEKVAGKNNIKWLEPWMPEGDSAEYSQKDLDKIEQLSYSESKKEFNH